jgi:hypothetical protein
MSRRTLGLRKLIEFRVRSPPGLIRDPFQRPAPFSIRGSDKPHEETVLSQGWWLRCLPWFRVGN